MLRARGAGGQQQGACRAPCLGGHGEACDMQPLEADLHRTLHAAAGRHTVQEAGARPQAPGCGRRLRTGGRRSAAGGAGPLLPRRSGQGGGPLLAGCVHGGGRGPDAGRPARLRLPAPGQQRAAAARDADVGDDVARLPRQPHRAVPDCQPAQPQLRPEHAVPVAQRHRCGLPVQLPSQAVACMHLLQPAQVSAPALARLLGPGSRVLECALQPPPEDICLHPPLARAANSGQWVARRDIEVGEMVTTSYLMRNDALPAPLRQAYLLEHYWFQCKCPW